MYFINHNTQNIIMLIIICPVTILSDVFHNSEWVASLLASRRFGFFYKPSYYEHALAYRMSLKTKTP